MLRGLFSITRSRVQEFVFWICCLYSVSDELQFVVEAVKIRQTEVCRTINANPLLSGFASIPDGREPAGGIKNCDQTAVKALFTNTSTYFGNDKMA